MVLIALFHAMTHNIGTTITTPIAKSSFMILPECEQFVGRSLDKCQGNAVGKSLAQCNDWRAYHGLPPLDNATPAPPDQLPPPNPAKPVQRGLGDAVESALTAVGITSERVSAWLGAECGCAARKARLNDLGAWAAAWWSGTKSDPPIP